MRSADFADRLPVHQLKTLRDLQHADELHLAPLRTALAAFGRAQQVRQPQVTLLRLARNLSAAYRATPKSVLMRLAPPQLRMLMGATSLAAATLKKLSPKTEEQEYARRGVLHL